MLPGSFTFVLSSFEWKLFATLTEERMRSDRKRRMSFDFFVNRMCRFQKKDPTRAVWLLRNEFGEQFGRPHYHLLWAGLSPEQLATWFVYRTPFFSPAQIVWAVSGGGFSRFRRVTGREDSAASYLGGCDSIAADEYELVKTSRHPAIVLSSELLRLLLLRESEINDGQRTVEQMPVGTVGGANTG